MRKLLTVIICTYNRAFILAECLNSLCEQIVPAEHYQLLIIDNNSTDNTRDLVLQFTGKISELQYIYEPIQGLAHARNRGLAEAQTEWVAFLDDDAKASPEWIQSILNTIDTGDFDCFGGPYIAWLRSGPRPVWMEENFGTYFGPGKYGILGEHYIPGGNCAFKKNLAEVAGGFPKVLGMKAQKCAYGEETYLFRKMQENGAIMGFVPEMLIEHCVLEYKYTLRWRLEASFAKGRDGSIALNIKDSSYAILKSLISNVVYGFLRAGRNACRMGYPWQKALLDWLMPICHTCGRLYTIFFLKLQNLTDEDRPGI